MFKWFAGKNYKFESYFDGKTRWRRLAILGFYTPFMYASKSKVKNSRRRIKC